MSVCGVILFAFISRSTRTQIPLIGVPWLTTPLPKGQYIWVWDLKFMSQWNRQTNMFKLFKIVYTHVVPSSKMSQKLVKFNFDFSDWLYCIHHLQSYILQQTPLKLVNWFQTLGIWKVVEGIGNKEIICFFGFILKSVFVSSDSFSLMTSQISFLAFGIHYVLKKCLDLHEYKHYIHCSLCRVLSHAVKTVKHVNSANFFFF